MSQYELFGGSPPAQAHSETSLAAAASLREGLVTHLQAKILRYLERGDATDEEMQAGIPMGPNTQRPRRRELELKGHVVDSGKHRPGSSGRLAVVWRLA